MIGTPRKCRFDRLLPFVGGVLPSCAFVCPGWLPFLRNASIPGADPTDQVAVPASSTPVLPLSLFGQKGYCAQNVLQDQPLVSKIPTGFISHRFLQVELEFRMGQPANSRPGWNICEDSIKRPCTKWPRTTIRDLPEHQ